nr:Unknown Function [uncultured bacterium]
MKIYVSHSREFDFKNDLYKPLRESGLPVEFILPHENSDEQYDSKLLLERHGSDLVMAEVSYPATGQGIELGWADAYKTDIVCFYKSGSTPSSSLQVITDTIIEYVDERDLVNKLTQALKLNYA